MPSSTVSLGSLSSPSPSPSPQPLPLEDHPMSTSNSGAAGLDIDSELSDLTEDEQENDKSKAAVAARAETREPRALREPKRKRGIVPPEMWGWVNPNPKGSKKPEWRTRPVEEEEEEELAGPAKAMEEEEDEDQDARTRRDRDDGRRKEPGLGGGSSRSASSHRRGASTPPYTVDRDRGGDGEGEGDDPDSDGEPEYDSESGGEDNSDRAMSLPPQLYVWPEDDPPEKVVAQDDGVESEDAAAEDVEMQQDTLPATVESVTPVEGAALMDADEPPPPLAVAAIGSSIMAGSSVIEPPSETSSSASASPSSSRSPSPEPEPEQEAHSEHEPEPEEVAPGRKTTGGRARARKGKARTRGGRKARAEMDAADADIDSDHAAVPDVDEGDGDAPEVDDVDLESAEMELESDLQPAHRAEALDVLATIELKFAMLRERLYVEKMDALAWEENLVAEGTHPEMLHLHAELSKRRDKRLELASRRRDYEVANVTKRRKLDEDAVWSWWQFVRDDLQTEMISETNRKRRRLERERRALERPQPVRRIPSAPLDVPALPSLREIIKNYPYGSSSTSSIQPRQSRSHGSAVPLAYPQLSLLSPAEVASDLDFLSQYRRNLPGFDPHRPVMMNAVHSHPFDPFITGVPMLDGPQTGNRFGPPPALFQHHVLPHAQMQGLGVTQGFAGHGVRPPHPTFHPSQVLDQDMTSVHAPGSAAMQPGVHLQQYPLGSAAGPASLMRRSISPVPVQSLNNGPGLGMSMGIGAPPMPPGLPGSKSNGWLDLPVPSSMAGGSKDLRRPNGDIEGRERENERDRYADGHKARERTDREREFEREREREREPDRMYQVQMMQQQRHPSHQHAHHHVHAPPGQASHHQLGPHHHHHHVHHVHHVHHHNQPSAGPSGHGSPMGSLPPPTMGSATGGREFETRRPRSGAPPEVIEVTAPGFKSMASPPMSSLWKDEPTSSSDMGRERGRPFGPPSVGPHERLMTPFVIAPSQVMLNNLPGSPRNGPGPPTGPPSVAPSRRSSYSATEENGLPRPPSASTSHQGSGHRRDSSVARRHSVSRSQRPPSTQPQNLFAASPRSNGRQLPPLPMSDMNSVPAFNAPLRSPRSSQPLLPPPPQMPATSSSVVHSPPIRPATPKANSPRIYRQSPSSPGQTKAPPRPPASNTDQFGAPAGAPVSAATTINVVNIKPSEPLSLFPPSSAHPNSLPPPRISNGGIPDRRSPHLAGPIAPKVVPVDGS